MRIFQLILAIACIEFLKGWQRNLTSSREQLLSNLYLSYQLRRGKFQHVLWPFSAINVQNEIYSKVVRLLLWKTMMFLEYSLQLYIHEQQANHLEMKNGYFRHLLWKHVSSGSITDNVPSSVTRYYVCRKICFKRYFKNSRLICDGKILYILVSHFHSENSNVLIRILKRVSEIKFYLIQNGKNHQIF